MIAVDARYINDRYHGIGRHAFNLLEALTRLDADRSYVLFSNPAYRNTRFDLRRLAHRPNVRLVPIRLPLFVPHEQLVWPLLLKRVGARLFHSPYFSVPLLARIPVIMTIHDLIFEHFPEYRPQRWLYWYYRMLTGYAVRRAASVFTVSHASRRDVERDYPAARRKIRVVGNGVDASFRREIDPATLARVRAYYGLPKRFILSLGAGRPHKNVEVLVDAFASLDPSRVPGLVLAGEVDTRFEDRVAQHIDFHRLGNRVIRIGGVADKDLPALYSLAELFVFPSLVEGFGFPVLEAMACGTPVLASTASSIPEVAGDAAMSFDPHQPDELARKIALMLGDASLHAAFAQRGPLRAGLFTWDQVARAALNGYAHVLGGATTADWPTLPPASPTRD